MELTQKTEVVIMFDNEADAQLARDEFTKRGYMIEEDAFEGLEVGYIIFSKRQVHFKMNGKFDFQNFLKLEDKYISKTNVEEEQE